MPSLEKRPYSRKCATKISGGPFSDRHSRATEPPAAIVRLRSVVIHEDTTEAAITKNGAAKFSNISGCFHPARRLRIERSEQIFALLWGQSFIIAFNAVHGLDGREARPSDVVRW